MRPVRVLTITGVGIGTAAAGLQATGYGGRSAVVACIIAWLLLTIAAACTPPEDWTS